ncbi:MAG: glucose-6-phosphate isomerase [Dehalococcoidia bacterium]|nr:glucose-6-phosphate isomerase [Dehalococcoidia bacterium]
MQNLGPLTDAVAARLERMRAERAVERLWEHDYTLWKPDPTEITNRLGWLHAVEVMTPELPRLREFARTAAAEGYERVALLGMGGSSLAPEVLYATFGHAPGALSLTVLDATDPAQVASVEAAAPLDHTLFIVASKSGGTLETLSHLAYFLPRAPRVTQFTAITDPGSALATIGGDHGFREVFLNLPDLGGRYAALTYVGLVPAALVGVDLEVLLGSARAMTEACKNPDPASNPGAWLGAVLGEGASAGFDQVTCVLPSSLATLGTWLEQLIAESTGKEGTGILLVEGEPLGPPEVYSDRRLFVALGSAGDDPALEALAAAGHPVVRLPAQDASDLGGEFFRWEFATAIAGYILGVQPFDQPNVQSAKDATARILERGSEAAPASATPSARALLDATQPGDYLAILAYLPRTTEIDARLQRVRVALRDRLHVATTIGYGPRYLHSTGQFHKGGPANGAFIEVVGDDPADLAIPGQPFSFGTLKHAQARGDLELLLAGGRPVARATLEELEALA